MGEEALKNLEAFKLSLESRGTAILDDIYIEYKDEFFNFGRKYGAGRQALTDIYQDAIIIFYENVVSGKLTELRSSIKTYIFSIGKYSIYNLKKKDRKTISLEREHLENLDLGLITLDQKSDTKVALVQEALNQLGENCRRILILFYYNSYTIEALMHEFDYKNENVVRAHKSRCLRNLKGLIKSKL